MPACLVSGILGVTESLNWNLFIQGLIDFMLCFYIYISESFILLFCFDVDRCSSSLCCWLIHCTLHCPLTCCRPRLLKTARKARSPAPLWQWRCRTRKMEPHITGPLRSSGMMQHFPQEWERDHFLQILTLISLWIITSTSCTLLIIIYHPE